LLARVLLRALKEQAARQVQDLLALEAPPAVTVSPEPGRRVTPEAEPSQVKALQQEHRGQAELQGLDLLALVEQLLEPESQAPEPQATASVSRDRVKVLRVESRGPEARQVLAS
jgi:hypothetical protein